MSWIKKFIILSLAFSFTLSISILALELISRIFVPYDIDFEAKGYGIIRDLEISFDVSNLYDSDKSKVIYSRDQFGLRKGCDNVGDVKMLTLGGSTTDQRYLSQTSTYQSRLQNLVEKSRDKDFCIANAGFDGHTTYANLFVLKELEIIVYQ